MVEYCIDGEGVEGRNGRREGEREKDLPLTGSLSKGTQHPVLRHTEAVDQ